MLTLNEVKEYLRITNNDEDTFIQNLIGVAEGYMKDAITDYEIKIKNERFKKKANLVELALIQNLFDERYFSGQKLELNYVITSMINQLEYGDGDV